MKLTSKGKRFIEEVPYGVYLWRMPDGTFVGDGEGHFLMIESMRGDQRRLHALADEARAYGIEEGAPCFFSGNRIVTDEEYEEQKLRLQFGLTPDPFDVPAIEEDRRNARQRR